MQNRIETVEMMLNAELKLSETEASSFYVADSGELRRR